MELLHPHTRDALAAQIKSDIDQFCKVTYNDGHRSHLGASIIGHVCNRALWYGFRWVQEAGQNSGRQERLFNRGHETEPRWYEWLRGIGCDVQDIDPATGKQWRITDYGGHFGGSCDGKVTLPARYQIAGQLLLEIKTHNDKSFNGVVKEGVKKAKPMHFAQMSVYGFKMGLKYALYCPINKNNDDIKPEIVELDWNLGKELSERRAHYVITATEPPPRLHENSTHVDCRMCDFFPVCHSSAFYAVNCRSCDNAVPSADGQWFCKRWQAMIPKDVLPKGCPEYHQAGRA